MRGERKESEPAPELKLNIKPICVNMTFYPNSRVTEYYFDAKLKSHGFGSVRFEHEDRDYYLSGGSWKMEFLKESQS